jgi:predicted dinucleotide-binding enzyme
MRLGILGTGGVAQTLAQRWSAVGHEISLGSRDPSSKAHLDFPVVLSDALVSDHDVVVNATLGSASLEVMSKIGATVFADKILVDVANANTPEFELLYPNSSLAEKLQDALPQTHVVKTMNTASMSVMTNPVSLPMSSIFVSGNDARAKSLVDGLLTDFGWKHGSVVDLGGIESARGPEHYFLLFAAIMKSLGTPQFNIKLIT